jgi:soluble lytic murein transglycosylase
MDVARLDCHALRAKLNDSIDEQFMTRAKKLWLTGSSQVKECNPVFDRLRADGLLDEELFRRRYDLAIAARHFRLARYLSGPLESRYRDDATMWLAALNQPAEFVRKHADDEDAPLIRQQLAYAIERIAFGHPAQAASLWAGLQTGFSFEEQQRATTERHIALWAARHHISDSYQMLSDLSEAARDAEVMRWRARSGLRSQQWERVLSSINDMQTDERALEQWRYWRAFAMQQIGSNEAARAEFLELSRERSYYGFLAADEIQQPYRFSHAAIVVDEKTIAELALRQEFIRARELFKVGLDGRGRSEWDAAVAALPDDKKSQAAILARRWGWHSRAIATAAKADQFDDLRIRFPLPYRTSFAEYSSKASVRPSWAYGVARNESLFMRDVLSSAGAVGVMQLMPSTGKLTAQEIKLPYSGRLTLIDPDANIRLGTHYLGKMYDRFGNNFVLATAAYNAGPHRVDRWLPQSNSLDARIWIENIPYNETRKYVRRVAETDVIFHWRLTGKVRRLSDELMHVPAAQRAPRVQTTD